MMNRAPNFACRFLLAMSFLTLPLNAALEITGIEEVQPLETGIDLTAVPGSETAHHVIVKPGTYRLTSDLDVTKPTGINIRAPGVTLDLNGYAIRRRVSVGDGHGILIALAADGCTVRNGSIRGFAYGVRAFSAGGSYRNLKVSDCTFAGIVGGSHWLIQNCEAIDNGETNIASGNASRIVTLVPAR